MRIALTGGSGALGKALIRRLVSDGAERIVAFSRCEQRRASLVDEFGAYPGIKDRIYAGDVRDERRLSDIFTGCEVVVHAAARKVVTAHADEPEELHKTNVIGTANVIRAAADAGVRTLLLISSDKAVGAENVYGVSKALAEHLVVAGNARTWSRGLRMAVVRYGNVVGSTGSVVVRWRQALARGEPLEVSDVRMTRFWLTLEQAVDVVLTSLKVLRGGEIFVPHLPAAPIVTLGHAIGGTAEYRETGIRPGGEKLHESLLSPSEVRRTLKWGSLYVVPPFDAMRTWESTPWCGEPVREHMEYQSDVWPFQLSVDALKAMVTP